ncbi:MAG: molybdate transport system substrate-binding protein [Actinomycetota bacterium]|nr:molybdate transport system substrate-binding protein [Actinomycetota bacterium]
MPRTAKPLVALVAVGALLTGCGGSSGANSPSGTSGSSGSSSATSSTAVAGTINVFAAASLQKAFTTLGSQFERKNPGTKVVFNFGPSSGLAEQISQGAPADVFASASTKTMDQVVTSGDAASPTDFVTNTMEIAVPPDNPAGITSVADLAKKGVKVALCQTDVPCGATALTVFQNAKVHVTPVTEEIDVKATLGKVSLGEVDAGVVYVTDVRAAGTSVKGIEIPSDVNASTTYPIATLTSSKNKATAKAFVDYVLSPDGLAALTASGFSKP